jgi:hypothetical protein
MVEAVKDDNCRTKIGKREHFRFERELANLMSWLDNADFNWQRHELAIPACPVGANPVVRMRSTEEHQRAKQRL